MWLFALSSAVECSWMLTPPSLEAHLAAVGSGYNNGTSNNDTLILKGPSLLKACLQPTTNTQKSKPIPQPQMQKENAKPRN